MTIDSINTPYTHRNLFLNEKNYYKIFNKLIDFNRSINEKYGLFISGSIYYVFYPMSEEFYLKKRYKMEFFDFLRTLDIDKTIIEKCVSEIAEYIDSLK